MTTTADGRPLEFSRDLAGRRYAASVGGTVVGTAEFLLTSDLIVFTHTEVDPSLEGQGVGAGLVRWALEDARDHGYSVVPSCPFVRSYISRHQDEFGSLVAQRPAS